jgi:hypothetical protein
MNDVMLVSFFDELHKIAESNSVVAGTSIGKPAPVASGMSVTKQIGSASRSPTKPTNYTVVHNQSPEAALGTADSSKAVLPPPVRA